MKVKREFKRQFFPGTTIIAENNRRSYNPEVKLRKLRELSAEDVVLLLGHRKPGEAIPTVHPPLAELTEPPDPIRELVDPTPGAKAGDRIRFVQISDTYHFSPGSPYPRARTLFSRYRAVDLGVLTARTIVEMRERDLEQFMRELLESEAFDPARTLLKGITTHGVAIRLDEDGLQFDALRRVRFDKERGEVAYVKDQLGVPLDEPIYIGRPSDEEDLKKRALQYHYGNVRYPEEPELHQVVERIWQLAQITGFNPDEVTDR